MNTLKRAIPTDRNRQEVALSITRGYVKHLDLNSACGLQPTVNKVPHAASALPSHLSGFRISARPAVCRIYHNVKGALHIRTCATRPSCTYVMDYVDAIRASSVLVDK